VSVRARELGRTGIVLPAIGQGTTRTGPWSSASPERDRERIAVLRLGIDLGMSLIDTAELYGGGHAEDVVGRAIAGRRHQVVLASKFNPEHSAAGDVVAAAEGSLRRLRTDYLDLYQMHWPEPRVPFEETVAGLEHLVRAGKVRAVGLGNLTVAELETARVLAGSLAFASVQTEYNLFQRAAEDDVLPFCRTQGLTFLAYSVLDRGVPPGGAGRALLDELAAQYARSAAQITLAWILRHDPVVALVKAAGAAHTRENAAAAELVLDDDDVARLDEVCCQRVMHVPPQHIRVRSARNPDAYASVDEARRNPRDLVPAPAAVALNVARGHVLKPLPLARAADAGDGRGYDLLDGEPLYWAWVIAHGMDQPMPVFVKEGSP
jgi:aryl-alcohol dehydrogenase-like predicted oxidoreductase